MQGKFDPFLLRIFIKALISAGDSEETHSDKDGSKTEIETERTA
jgi:hypothetical protein